MKRITKREQLQELAAEWGMRTDWHEPDEQGVTAEVAGHIFDNAGFWPAETNPEILEQHVILVRNGVAEAAVNLASLLSWAAQLDGKRTDCENRDNWG